MICQTKRVWKHSPYESGMLLVHLALAEHANKAGGCWPSTDRLSSLTRLSNRQVNRALRQMAEDGNLRLPKDRSERDPILLIWDADVLAEDAGDSDPETWASPSCARQDGSEPSVGTTSEPAAQESLLPDPVEEVWELHQTLARKRRRAPERKERKWIADAIKVCGVEQVKLAVRGLAASEHHRSGGWTGIEYAVRPKANETVESRVTMMAAKVPVHDSQATDGRLTIQELLHGYTGYNRQRVLDWMKDVRRALIEPSEQNTKMAALAEQELSDRAGIIVIERGERNLIWGKKA